MSRICKKQGGILTHTHTQSHKSYTYIHNLYTPILIAYKCHTPVSHCLPSHPGAQVQVLGREQVPPFRQGWLHKAEKQKNTCTYNTLPPANNTIRTYPTKIQYNTLLNWIAVGTVSLYSYTDYIPSGSVYVRTQTHPSYLHHTDFQSTQQNIGRYLACCIYHSHRFDCI